MPNLKFQGNAIKMVRRFCDSSILTEHLFIHGFNSGLYLADVVSLDVNRVVSLERVQEDSLRNILTSVRRTEIAKHSKGSKVVVAIKF